MVGGQVVERLCFTDEVSGETTRKPADLPFFAKQDRELIARNRLIDPQDIGDYIASGGYSALAQVLTSMDPDAVVKEIEASGLRGRGGGGYPTARKWEQSPARPGRGTLRHLQRRRGRPGRVHGSCAAGGQPPQDPRRDDHRRLRHRCAAGLHLRPERISLGRDARPQAIEQARDVRLPWPEHPRDGLRLRRKVARGGGAFVCGESTALMASLEGEAGRAEAQGCPYRRTGLSRPAHQPEQRGDLGERPADRPRTGPTWFATMGTGQARAPRSSPSRARSRTPASSRCRWGRHLREIIFDIGGGARDGKAFKAVQTGGPSGGCLPASLLDLPVDFDALAEAGSMMGSGGMVVMDEETCMVDVARYFVEFLAGGVLRQVRALPAWDSPHAGDPHGCLRGPGPDAAARHYCRELAGPMAAASLCALGKTAPNPVLSTLQYFQSEYEAHIRDHRCPAGVCQALLRYSIEPDLCTLCGLCAGVCPHGAIIEGEEYLIDQVLCEQCGICADDCPAEAILRS